MKTTKKKRSSRTAATAPALADSAASEPGAAIEQVESPVASRPEPVVLPASCTLREAVALKETLLSSVDVENALSMDARAVERIDTAGMQVLAAFVRERATQSRTVEWLGLSETFLEAVRLLGLSSSLSIPDTAGASV